MLNRIKIVKDLFLQKLDSTLAKLESQEKVVFHLAENDNLLLQSITHLVELLSKTTFEIKQQQDATSYHLYNNLEQKQDSFLRQLQSDLKLQRAALLHQLQSYLKQEDSLMRQLIDDRGTSVKVKLNIEPKSDNTLEPDDRLMAFLYSFLPSRVAVDVGANYGNVSELLLQAGYQVYAFEPYSVIFDKLQKRHAKYKDFHAFNYAIGPNDATTDLYLAQETSKSNFYKNPSLYNTLLPHSMPNGLDFTEKIAVSVRSIDSLQKTGEIPHSIGLIKIDTEGYDLEVIRGMTAYQAPVVVTEFWDYRHIFAQSDTFNRLDNLVDEMKQRNYHWYIVFARIDQLNGEPFSYDVVFYCNFPLTMENSWGNVFFFRDYETFKKALDWCSAMLPTAYFA